MRHYKNGPKEIKPIPRMTDSTFHCLIRDSLFRDLAHQYEGENLDRLHGLMHDVAEETLARVSMDTPSIAPPVAAGSVDMQRYAHGYSEMVEDDDGSYVEYDAAIAWGAQQREAGKKEAEKIGWDRMKSYSNQHVSSATIRMEERVKKAEEGLAQLQYERDNLQKLAISRREWAEKAEAELAQVNQWRAAALASNQQMQELMVAKLASVEARVKELEEDAMRWRYLRDLDHDLTGTPGQPCVAIPDGASSGHYATGKDAVIAVDLAMGKSS